MKIRFVLLLSLVLSVVACKKEPPAPLPSADFYVSNNGCVAPCSLYFYDASENAIRWNWKFGNGVTSITKNDTILFSLAGNYETWLEIWNADEVKDSIRKIITIN